MPRVTLALRHQWARQREQMVEERTHTQSGVPRSWEGVAIVDFEIAVMDQLLALPRGAQFDAQQVQERVRAELSAKEHPTSDERYAAAAEQAEPPGHTVDLRCGGCGAEGVVHHGGCPPAMRSSSDTLELLSRNLGAGDGTIAINCDEGNWVVGITWGREAPDSDMAGAAAYGMGDTMAQALNAALDETGWQL